MKYFKPLILFVLGWGLLLMTSSLSSTALINGLSQMILFGVVVCWPIWKTGRLSYVDIGWPWGLFVIGVLTLLFGQGYHIRVWVVSAVYMFIGARMGLGAIKLWQMGWMKREFPRYEYQKRRWKKAGKTNVPFAMQVDALAQGLANASFLSIPALLIGWNADPNISFIEIVGLIIWGLAYVMEATADAQKLSFLKKMSAQGKKNQVCDEGLWRYTRHPNYFAEWMVWNGLTIASIPSWWVLKEHEHIAIWILIGLSLLFIPRIMYMSLVYLTGAVPSEFYSLQKRPDYKAYKERTNMFFPGPTQKLY